MNFSEFQPRHFRWELKEKVGIVTLNRPEKKNPLTFESYAELRDMFRELVYTEDVKAVVIAGEGGNFCSGGDVHEIIGPLTKMDMRGLLNFTRMTGDLIKAIRGSLPSTGSVSERAPPSPWLPTCG
jgi:enoyl-CoA hydratase/carnithine racemase